MTMQRRHGVLAAFGTVALCATALSAARTQGDVRELIVFEAGQTAVAEDVNRNFKALDDDLVDLVRDVGVLDQGLDDLETGVADVEDDVSDMKTDIASLRDDVDDLGGGSSSVAPNSVGSSQIIDGSLTGADVSATGPVFFDELTVSDGDPGIDFFPEGFNMTVASDDGQSLHLVGPGFLGEGAVLSFGDSSIVNISEPFDDWMEIHAQHLDLIAPLCHVLGDFDVFGLKNFLQPHPTDASKAIRFSSLEGGESGTYFRGTAALEGGVAVIEVPETFRLVSEPDGLTVQTTPLGPGADLWVESEGLDRVVVRGSVDVEFDFFVNGVRRGFADYTSIVANESLRPDVRGVPYATNRSEAYRRILVENGTLNPDYTPNEETALRLGWELREPGPGDLKLLRRSTSGAASPKGD